MNKIKEAIGGTEGCLNITVNASRPQCTETETGMGWDGTGRAGGGGEQRRDGIFEGRERRGGRREWMQRGRKNGWR